MKTYLLTPGPSPIPEEVMASFAKPVLHHRSPDFIKLFQRVKEDVKYVFQTKNDVVFTASSGTGGMEAAIGACFNRGEKVLNFEGGKFGERWTSVGKRYGLNVIKHSPEYGSSFSVDTVKKLLAEHPDATGVIMVASETSTGVQHPIKEVGELLKNTDKLFLVDGITAVGVFPIKTDDWGLDIVAGGAQKAFMLPPGLGMVSVSEKAKKKMEKTGDSPSYYLDLKKELKMLKDDQTAFTPAVSLIQGLEVSLKMIKEETMERIWLRNSTNAKAVRAAGKALGLELFAKENPSDAITAIKSPPGIDTEKVVKLMRDKHGVTITGGQDNMKGTIVRFAHLGYIYELDVIIALTAFEYCLHEVGYTKFKLGTGVSAAMELFQGARKK